MPTDEQQVVEQCDWMRWSDEHPRCRNIAVGPRYPMMGNLTDAFVWCAEHGGQPPQETER